MRMKLYPEEIQKLERQVSELNDSEDTKEIDKYYEFFNAETQSIEELITSKNIEALIERNNKYRDILFETRTKLKASIRGLQTAFSKMSDEEKAKYSEYEVSAIDTTDFAKKSPYAKAVTKDKKKKDAISALEALGLDGASLINFANKFGTGPKAKELADKRNESIQEVTKLQSADTKAENEVKKAEITAKIEAVKTEFKNPFRK